jgi:hypothetical protein
MSELVRTIAARMRVYIGDRRWAKRCRARLSFSVSVVGHEVVNGSHRPRSLEGHTLDLSTSGLALVVPAIRIDGHYLTGADQRLQIQLALPTGTVTMRVVPVRYESLEDGTGYLIGVRIEHLAEPDREQYVAYVRQILGK